MRAVFMPQRLYPRYSGLADVASRVPKGLPALMASVGPLIASRPGPDETLGQRHEASIHLAIVAYPRTGSVVMQELSDRLLANSGSSIRTHDPLRIRTFATDRVPVLIPIRDPRETIISWSVYNSDPVEERFLRARSHSYLAWARKVLRMSHRFPLHSLDLETFVNDPRGVLTAVLGAPDRLRDSNPRSDDAVLEDLATFEGSPVNRQHTPSEARERIKDEYRPLLDSRKVTRLINEAADLNAEILASSAYAPARTRSRA